jgi:hypothetical protein
MNEGILARRRARSDLTVLDKETLEAISSLDSAWKNVEDADRDALFGFCERLSNVLMTEDLDSLDDEYAPDYRPTDDSVDEATEAIHRFRIYIAKLAESLAPGPDKEYAPELIDDVNTLKVAWSEARLLLSDLATK